MENGRHLIYHILLLGQVHRQLGHPGVELSLPPENEQCMASGQPRPKAGSRHVLSLTGKLVLFNLPHLTSDQ